MGRGEENKEAEAAAAAAALHQDVNTQVNYQNTLLPLSPHLSLTGQREHVGGFVVRG